MANECVHSRLKERISGFIRKLDLEKAYDRVDWKFLQYMLRRLGFGETWRMWIQGCLVSLVLYLGEWGSPKGYSQAGRGQRQTDPLSRFLSLIVAEALRLMINKAVSAGLFEGFTVARNSPAISHLQYVDDTLIFYGAEEDQVRNVKATIQCFEAMSGLKVNSFKSEVIGQRTKKQLLLHC